MNSEPDFEVNDNVDERLLHHSWCTWCTAPTVQLKGNPGRVRGDEGVQYDRLISKA